MNRSWMTVSLVLIVAASAWAQDRPGGDRPGRQRRGDPADSERVPVSRNAQAQITRAMDQLEKDLELSNEQLTKFQAARSTYRDRVQANRERGEDVNLIIEEMRKAERRGDTDRMEQLSGQIRQLHEESRGLVAKFCTEVEEFITPAQAPALDRFREKMSRLAAQRRGMMTIKDIESLPAELKLDEKQTQKFETLFAKLRSDNESANSNADAQKALAEEFRKAIEAGDKARAEEIRAEIAAGAGDSKDPYAEFFTELEKVLTDDQQRQLAVFRGNGPRPGQPLEPQDYIRIARRLDLSDEQQEQLRAIEKETRESLRSVRPRDKDELQRVGDQVRKDVTALLTPEQAADFDKRIEELNKVQRDPGSRLRRGDRDDGQGRGGEPRGGPTGERKPKP